MKALFLTILAAVVVAPGCRRPDPTVGGATRVTGDAGQGAGGEVGGVEKTPAGTKGPDASATPTSPISPTAALAAPSASGPSASAQVPKAGEEFTNPGNRPDLHPSNRPWPKRWQDVTNADLYLFKYDILTPDDDKEMPFAWEEPLEDFIKGELDQLRKDLPKWQPGLVEDPVQRVRNLLYVAVMPDVARVSLEGYAPLAVLDQLQKAVPNRDDLLKILFWIILTPDQGEVSPANQVEDLGFVVFPAHPGEIRFRAMHYAAKMILRLTN